MSFVLFVEYRTIRSNFQNDYICLPLCTRRRAIREFFQEVELRNKKGIVFRFDENIRDPKTKMAHSSTVLDNLVKVNRVSFVKFVLLSCTTRLLISLHAVATFHQLSQLSLLFIFLRPFSVFDLIFGQKISRIYEYNEIVAATDGEFIDDVYVLTC